MNLDSFNRNMMYIRSQNYTNMVVGEYGIQTFRLVIVVLLLLLLLFDVFVPTSAHLFLSQYKRFVQTYLNLKFPQKWMEHAQFFNSESCILKGASIMKPYSLSLSDGWLTK